MANTGYILPQSASSTSEIGWGDTGGAWISPENIYGAGEASITDNAFDAGDASHVLRGYNFNLSSIPNGSTINGIICRVMARASSPTTSIGLAQLLSTTGTRVGTNLAATPITITGTTSAAEHLIGASNNLWGNSLTESWVKDADFGVGIGVINGSNNADVFIDSVEIDVYYTAPPGTDLVLSDLENGSTSDNIVLTQTHILSIQDESNNSTVDNVALTQVHSVLLSDLDNSSSIDNITLTQIHSLAIQDLANDSTIDGDLVLQQSTASIDLVFSDLANDSSIDNLQLTQVHSLQISDIENNSTLDNVVLTQIHYLQAEDLSNQNTIDSILITQVHSLLVSDLENNSTFDNVSLTQIHILEINDLANNSTIDGNLILTEGSAEINLVFQDISVSSTIGNIDLVQIIDLQIDSLQNSISIDNILLTQTHHLLISDLENESTIDSFDIESEIAFILLAFSYICKSRIDNSFIINRTMGESNISNGLNEVSEITKRILEDSRILNTISNG